MNISFSLGVIVLCARHRPFTCVLACGREKKEIDPERERDSEVEKQKKSKSKIEGKIETIINEHEWHSAVQLERAWVFDASP